MKKTGHTAREALSQLKVAATLFGGDASVQKQKWLKVCSGLQFRSAKDIIAYHDCLLFLLAYPASAPLYALAETELMRLGAFLKNLKPSSALYETLSRSGLAYTSTQSAYSLELIRWMLQAFPAQVELHSLDEQGKHPQSLLRYSLPVLEFELAAEDSLKPLAWLEKACGSKNKGRVLRWVVDQIDRLPASGPARELLFESLQLYVNIKPAVPELSRSFGRSLLHPVYIHDKELLKKFDAKAVLNTKLNPRKKLQAAAEEHLLKTSRVALAMLNRETEPITYCRPGQVEYYELDRGLSIALFSMNPDQRMPLESYIGYMMFKNGQPMAYGGCWILGKRALAGVNIFEPFRGGESALVFCNILRVYRQRFGISYFEVEPYQFGKGNPEGIRSGAFWFYYRFGFRPLRTDLAALAEQEQAKIAADKTYRSSYTTLKQLTGSNIGWHIDAGVNTINPSEISKTITAYIHREHLGNRAAAEKHAHRFVSRQLGVGSQKSWSEAEKQSYHNLCLWVVVSFPDLARWSTGRKQNLLKLMRLKGSDEFAYIDFYPRVAGK